MAPRTRTQDTATATATAPVPDEQNRGGNAPANATPTGIAPGRGRKELCGQALDNGRKCELWKGHGESGSDQPKEHMTVDITEDDVTGEFLSEDEIAEVVKSQAAPDEKQLKVNAQIGRGWAEYVKRGSADPVWMSFTTEPHKVQRMERMLRVAADTNEPPVQLKDGGKKFADGKVRIVVGVAKRRVYAKRGTAGQDNGQDAAAANAGDSGN
jgi:hypothetical protein